MPATAVWMRRAELRFRMALSLTLLAGVIAVGFVALMFVGSFAWPVADTGSTTATVRAGKVNAFTVDQPVFYAEGKFWLVRKADGSFDAFAAHDTSFGCTLPWRETFSFRDPNWGQDRKGWFRSPCHGDTYDIDGTCVGGPCTRNLDRYPVEVSGNDVVVHAAEYKLIRGVGLNRPFMAR